MVSPPFRTAALAAAAWLLALASPASAMPIVESDGDVATGIQNLDVTSQRQTEIFNVSFLLITFNDLQADGGAPIYDGELFGSDERWAEDVAEAIADALNDYGGLDAMGPDADTSLRTSLIPFDGTTSKVDAERVVATARGFTARRDVRVDKDQVWIYASLTIVPEPATALLLGMGLAGMGALGRRR